MTDNTGEQLMQELLTKNLSDWSKDEIDGFIVDAYLSLKAAMGGQLHTSDGLPVKPNMGEWGDVYDANGEGDCEDRGCAPSYCVACLAGTFFVSKVGSIIPEDEHPQPFPYSVGGSRTVLQLLDGLRYLEEGMGVDGKAINTLLLNMGYAVIPIGEGEEEDCCIGSSQRVALRLQRFIDLNPRLTERLRIATTKEGL